MIRINHIYRLNRGSSERAAVPAYINGICTQAWGATSPVPGLELLGDYQQRRSGVFQLFMETLVDS
jgi:hypothetical protein